jgi:hypothetical protein
MQPPPPTGCTGKAPPGAGGGVTLDEAAVVVIAGIAVMSPTAKTRAVTAPHNATTVPPCRFLTIHKCSHSPPNAHHTRPDSENTPRSHQESSKVGLGR